ncbi:hypothetical protein FOL47_010348 [Perkinsus chesapeaki]|uniref:Uncharacterized protein n=1 Tax=Perkinsus chesapeaki TaxID=330153 RepID=A0A7J6L2I1_PERCH|nr:hypothetical protein FOL47_010348 [Perkinsus chesapeaki]
MILSSAAIKNSSFRVPIKLSRVVSTRSLSAKSRWTGYVSQYDRYQGYGFISPETPLPGTNSLRDVFVHRNDVDWPDFTRGVTRALEAGREVGYCERR